MPPAMEQGSIRPCTWDRKEAEGVGETPRKPCFSEEWVEKDWQAVAVKQRRL